jgi:DNA (cytosine-5)-methyltransferase 1
MNELALFAGAGGGILGGKLLGWRTVCAVERDAHAARVLVQRQNDGHLEGFPIWDDIRTFDGFEWRGRVDVVSGGFPCQAFSSAASGRNTADDLWPEMRRVVADVAPRYVFAENVQRRPIDRAAEDLEEMGYRTRCLPLSAKDLGADHIRPRYWLLAYADGDGELLRTINAEASLLPGVGARLWGSEPRGVRMADGVARRVDRLRAVGNGQVPAVAAAAWRILAGASITDRKRG